MQLILVTILAVAWAALPSTAVGQPPQHDHQMSQRGRHAMGFDQDATVHHFLLKKSGGTIEITAKDPADRVSIGSIRSHLEHIRAAFASGDFKLPMFIHATEPPGVGVLSERRARLTYTYEELPAGGRVEIVTSDPDALAALHAFLKFQIAEHRTGDAIVVR